LSQDAILKQSIGQAILLQERAASFLHNRQRLQDLEKAPFQERIANLMQLMNGELSMPDERRESMLAGHTKSILQNTTIKSQLTMYLAIQAQIERLSVVISTVGKVDQRLCDPTVIDEMTPSQLIFLQKSLHQQIGEIGKFIEGQRLDGLEGVLVNITPQDKKDVQETVSNIEALPAAGRERLQSLLSAIMTKLNKMEEPTKVVELLPETTPVSTPSTEAHQ
jgi:hypothetical protein